MPAAVVQGPSFEKLLDTVEILRKHYAVIVARADTLAFRLHVRGDMAGFRDVRALRQRMREDHDRALDLIADKLTSPDELMATRHALTKAKRDAHDFIKRLQRIEMTLRDLQKATQFLASLVTNLTRILT